MLTVQISRGEQGYLALLNTPETNPSINGCYSIPANHNRLKSEYLLKLAQGQESLTVMSDIELMRRFITSVEKSSTVSFSFTEGKVTVLEELTKKVLSLTALGSVYSSIAVSTLTKDSILIDRVYIWRNRFLGPMYGLRKMTHNKKPGEKEGTYDIE
ncbi:MAG: hypothetical protein ACPGEF_06680 [Endozoicomonas sp.]